MCTSEQCSYWGLQFQESWRWRLQVQLPCRNHCYLKSEGGQMEFLFLPESSLFVARVYLCINKSFCLASTFVLWFKRFNNFFLVLVLWFVCYLDPRDVTALSLHVSNAFHLKNHLNDVFPWMIWCTYDSSGCKCATESIFTMSGNSHSDLPVCPHHHSSEALSLACWFPVTHPTFIFPESLVSAGERSGNR